MAQVSDERLRILEIAHSGLEKGWERLWGPMRKAMPEGLGREWLEQVKRTVASLVVLERQEEALQVCTYAKAKGVELGEVEREVQQEKHHEPVEWWAGGQVPPREDMQ